MIGSAEERPELRESGRKTSPGSSTSFQTADRQVVGASALRWTHSFRPLYELIVLLGKC